MLRGALRLWSTGVVVQSGTTERIEPGLRVSVGNFWESLYLDSEGRRKNGLTAGLWLALDGSDSTTHVRVHPGKRVQTDWHWLEVVEVGTGSRPFVRLQVTQR